MSKFYAQNSIDIYHSYVFSGYFRLLDTTPNERTCIQMFICTKFVNPIEIWVGELKHKYAHVSSYI